MQLWYINLSPCLIWGIVILLKFSRPPGQFVATVPTYAGRVCLAIEARSSLADSRLVIKSTNSATNL